MRLLNVALFFCGQVLDMALWHAPGGSGEARLVTTSADASINIWDVSGSTLDEAAVTRIGGTNATPTAQYTGTVLLLSWRRCCHLACAEQWLMFAPFSRNPATLGHWSGFADPVSSLSVWNGSFFSSGGPYLAAGEIDVEGSHTVEPWRPQALAGPKSLITSMRLLPLSRAFVFGLEDGTVALSL